MIELCRVGFILLQGFCIDLNFSDENWYKLITLKVFQRNRQHMKNSNALEEKDLMWDTHQIIASH